MAFVDLDTAGKNSGQDSPGRIRTCVVGSKARQDWPLPYGASEVRPPGFEPGSLAWKANVLPD